MNRQQRFSKIVLLENFLGTMTLLQGDDFEPASERP